MDSSMFRELARLQLRFFIAVIAIAVLIGFVIGWLI